MKVSNWLFNSVQNDLKNLQQEYKKIGYDLTIEQCYEVWYTYSERCCANWLNISNVENSKSYVEEILKVNSQF
jgi:hypothetical protein